MWISRGDDFLNITDEEYDNLLKEAWNNMPQEDKKEYKNNFMVFKKECEEYDEDYFYLPNNVLEKFNNLRKEYSGMEISSEKLQEILKEKWFKSSKIEEPNLYTIYLDNKNLDEEAREQLNWEYSFDLEISQ
ncbi:hypothetical protein SAMN02745174_00418 [Cetobacterium ceti]|uniref:Uncharacterized protein n=1 Tax=Cetobacterium ceti TaxID=180163 RepID=A0A1T4KGH0_9FUSO|nr:hypothetical protein [Cetobacterium ceti]SJZ41528.1 hypothetical protein SAMN02745174_00418 [Cetobacterium ceti]